MKNVIVIFIMPVDPFGEGRMIYTIRSMCEESPNLPYDDGARTLYLYTKGTKGNPPNALRQLLHYIEQSTEENAVNDSLKRLHHMVETVKLNGEVALSYMKSWDREERIRETGRVEGRAEGRAEERRKAELERQKIEEEVLRLRTELAHYKEELRKERGH